MNIYGICFLCGKDVADPIILPDGRMACASHRGLDYHDYYDHELDLLDEYDEKFHDEKPHDGLQEKKTR